MSTQLNYDIKSDKEPLYTTVDQLNQSSADLTFTATNAGKAPVNIKAIEIALSQIEGGMDIVALLLPGSAAGIGVSYSFAGPEKPTWSAAVNDALITFTPPGGSAIFRPGDKFTVVLANVVIREGGTGTAMVPVFEESDKGKAQTEVGIGITESTLDVQLTIDNNLIGAGQTVTLKWTTNDASSGVLTMPGSSPDTVPLNSTNLASGQQSITPIENTTFSLTCQGRGPAVMRQVTISIQEVQIANFYSSASDFNAAETVTLYWQTQYASKCTISTKEGSGDVTVPVQNNQTASCKVSASGDGTQLILSKIDGSGELGRITLPTPCPSSVTFLFEADGSNPKQSSWVVNLLRVQIIGFTQQVSSQTTSRTIYPPPPRWVDPNMNPPDPYTITTTTYMLQLTWNVSNPGSLLVASNGDPVSTASIGSWQSGYDYGSPPTGTITCQGFGGPVGH